ncbi:MAG: MerC domain-containing protein [Xanthomonadales bacterium]|jgi:Na+-translocating ferredoxin:NAD+ oxidoreductase RnfD subunit|nr:MerC domain-containing protein [Xanthomonadales bacterium]MBK7144601.1 MerC domain-containing protein [Xanthomonadales bacterium]MCC6561904.1 MerC domain-containing protein [Xanthomonadales bacterium]
MSADSVANQLPERSRRWHQRLDWLGAGASFVCALHCAALPVVLALAPLAGAHWLASHRFDQWAVSVALLFGAAVIGAAYCTHRWRQVLAMYLGSALLMLAAAFFVHEPAWLHAAMLVAGGLLLALTHLSNRRSARRHGCTRNLWAELLGLD